MLTRLVAQARIWGNPTEPLHAGARAYLDRGTATLRAFDLSCQVRVRSAATPIEGILEEIEAGDHDGVVIGSHGLSARKLFKRNEVMLQVLANSNRPMLVVPTDKV